MNNHNQITTWPKRLFALDISRGFASIVVIIWHWQHFAFDNYSLPTSFDKSTQPLYKVLRIFYEDGFRAVEFFFLLSGYIFFWLYKERIKNNEISVKDFFVSRFSRLYPLHFVTLLLVLCLQAYFLFVSNSYFVYEFNDLYHFILNLFFASNWGFQEGSSFNSPVWSVSIEILLYVLFFIVAYKKWGSVVFCIIVSLLSFALSRTLIYSSLLVGISSFFLGGAVYYLTNLITSKFKNLEIWIIFIFVISWILVITNFYIFSLSNQLLSLGLIGKIILSAFPVFVLFPVTISALTIMELRSYINLNLIKSFTWLGDITYSTYLFHFPLQLLFAILVINDIIPKSFYLNTFYFILFFCLLLPISYIIYLKFEKPMQKILRKRYLR